MVKKSLIAVAALLSSPAVAVECPKDMTSCKVLYLSSQEENALTAPNGVLATAAQARKLDLGDISNYFIEKIKNAPAGEVKKPEPPKPQEQK